MIGIILAAGSGHRLQKDLNMQNIGPKCLIKINDFSLLERHIYDFMREKFEKVVIISGFREDILCKEVKKFSEKYAIEIEIVKNSEYSTTNTAFSLFLGLEKINNSDVIIINGDVLYDSTIFSDITSTSKTSMVIDNNKVLTQESYKVIISNGQISSIGKTIPIKKSNGEYIGLSKINRDILSNSKKKLRQLIDMDQMSYYDTIFKDLSAQTEIKFIFTNGRKWTEIDDINDYRFAQEISSNIDKTRMMKFKNILKDKPG